MHQQYQGKRAVISGVVQGVGFRPYVYHLAVQCELNGSVHNSGKGVVIEIFGKRSDEFFQRLPVEAPPLVLITDISVETIDVKELPKGFTILHSKGEAVTTALIPADAALCADCLRELFDPTDRRYRYPFINCTNCGPRYTITSGIPYDRSFTSMKVFPMCERCLLEYNDPNNRRFHAQPNACPDCGPWLHYHDADTDSHYLQKENALEAAIQLLRKGGILAVRGLGGYHLAADATNHYAVMELRKRKRRFEKPLAVMLRDMEKVRACCSVSEAEAELLMASQHPIVVLSARLDNHIAPAVSLDNPTIGVMLPYTPLHVLLSEEIPALVMSSANLSEEPICIGIEEAEKRLAGIVDGFLHHNREILQRCDDSVFRVMNEKPRPIRRARGYVPRPVLLPSSGPPVLAVGAELKNTFCLAFRNTAILSQHIGDLENLEALHFFEETLLHLMQVFEFSPAAIAYDMHPGYLGTQWANNPVLPLFKETLANLPRIPIQHHHAHFASCLAENNYTEQAIGVILDGTGYGPDGVSWGGEFLIGTTADIHRAAHFHELPLPGGDAAIREPWRMAWAALTEAGLDPVKDFPAFSHRRSEAEREAIYFALTTGVNTAQTTGCGRLFDAIASLIGLADFVSFEAQAAIALEFAACNDDQKPYTFEVIEPKSPDMPIRLSFLPAIREIVNNMHVGIAIENISRRFHNTIIAGCAALIQQLAEINNCNTVALSGGVFQNALLLEGLMNTLQNASFTVLTHRLVPANDGGISLGQAVISRTKLKG